MTRGGYVHNVLIALDQLFNAVLLGNPKETVSDRAYRAERAGRRWGCVLCRALEMFERDHCAKSAAALADAAAGLSDPSA